MRLHKGSGDAAGDGDELGGAGEDLDERSRRELGEVDLHAVAEAAGDLLVDGNGGQLREQGAGVREQGSKGRFGIGGVGGCLELVYVERVVEGEGAGAGSAEAGEVGSTAGELAELMGYGPDVAAGGDSKCKAGGLVFKRKQTEIVDEDASRLDGHGEAGAGKLVGGDAAKLFRGEDRRHLVHRTLEVSGELLERCERLGKRAGFGGGGAVGVKAIRGEAEADGAGVLLVGLGPGLREELGQAGVAAEQQGQDAGGHGVKGAEMADGFFTSGAADEGDDVVRGEGGGFVEDQKAVERHGVFGDFSVGCRGERKPMSQKRDMGHRLSR